ncbi:MAG: glycine cleavage system protein GcvH, partial [Pseudomonadota bacterium]
MSHLIPADLKYTKDHEWARIEGKTVTFGITDFAQSNLGDIVFIELPEVGNTIAQGSACGVIESIKSVSDLCAPASGKVLAVNQEVEGNPAACNSDAFGSWLVKIEATAPGELTKLMNADQYK